MLPLRDVIPPRRAPRITRTLMAVAAGVWVFELTLPEDALKGLLRAYGVVPADFRAPSVITSLFLHAGWLQFVADLWYLWIFGDNVEDRLGRGGFAGFYLLCGVGPLLAHIATSPASPLPVVGAGGAVSGILGTYLVLYPRSKVLTLVPRGLIELPAAPLVAFWFVLQLVATGTVPGPGVGALVVPIGGFLMGIGIAKSFRTRWQADYWRLDQD